MNKVLLFVCFMCLVASLPTQVYAQKCYAPATASEVQQLRFLVGSWQGEVVERGGSRTLHMRFFEQAGQLMATVQQQGRLVPLTAQASLCAPGKFHLFGLLPGGERFAFNARAQETGLVGSYAEGTGCSVANKPTFAVRRVRVQAP